MDKNYVLVFDKVMVEQLKRLAKDQQTKQILTKMLNKLEFAGPLAGRLIDSKLFLYEIKNKHPPLRLYFKPVLSNNEIYVFEFETKTSEDKQRRTIQKLKMKTLKS